MERLSFRMFNLRLPRRSPEKSGSLLAMTVIIRK